MIGPVQAKILVQHFGEAEKIFKASPHFLEKLEGIGTVKARSIKSFKDFKEAEKEIRFIEKFCIKPIFLTDAGYPKRLLNCYDSPTLLFYKGQADLNAARMIAVIGTRNHTEYARQMTEKLIRNLAPWKVTIISGLAFGIDGLAHKNAMHQQLQTIGVLGHGFQFIYPQEHSGLARDMLKNDGGLLTEFRSNTKPDKHNFPTRNRIVAGMSDAVLVVESGMKGGSMVTADLANGYNKDVFAIPGKLTDHKSEGCNDLVKNNKAVLFTDAQQLAELMGWEKKSGRPQPQKEIFVDLSPDEKTIVDLLREKENIGIDELNFSCGNLSTSAVAAALLNLELKGLVGGMPGKQYRLL